MAKKKAMKKRYHNDDKHFSGMLESFRKGSGSSRDEMISSEDGLFPRGVKIKDYDSAGYTVKRTPYDGIAGVNEQEDDDAEMLRHRKTKGSF